MAGLSPSDPDRDKVRGVRYRDSSGAVHGVMAFRLSERSGSFRFALQITLLAADTAEARAALWQFALQHDLVDEVTADLRPLDDALPWLVRDQRGVTQTVHDHGWLRVLDVRAALEQRRYSAPLDAVLHVQDALGFAAGSWRLVVDDRGRGTVTDADGRPADVELDVSELSVIYAGGVRASTLHDAGRLDASAEIVAALDRAFLSSPAPSLDIWY
nr:sterol carrier protein domain-containing protein [Microbacterium hydrocarbonoxydans]